MITIRHLLSHSSGLPHGALHRRIAFKPGMAYFYSAKGYEYLQAVIEEVTEKSLGDVARECVFAPLGMSSSSFVNRRELLPRTANGHLRYVVPLVAFWIMHAITLIFSGIAGILIHRVRGGRWWPPRRVWMLLAAIVFMLTLLIVFVLLQRAHSLEFAWMIALCGSAFAVVLVGTFLIGWKVISGLLAGEPKAKTRRLLVILWSVLSSVAMVWAAFSITNAPVPKWPAVEANAAGIMRATAGDLASFLIELPDPRFLSKSVAAQVRTPQTRAGQNISWGLGPGIQHSRQGDDIWQWGQTLDFQSVMAIYPEEGIGVVVLTNSDIFHPLIVFDVAQRALGGRFDGIRRAANLEFNRRPESAQ